MPLYKRSTGDAVPCRVLDENPDGTLNIEYLRNRKWIRFDRVAAHKVTDKHSEHFEHSTVLKNFLAGLGPRISACFAQVKVP